MARGVALALLLAAAAGWLGVVVPARRGRDRARAEYAQARLERERLRSGLTGQRRRAGATAASDAMAASRALRLALLRATQGVPVEAVEIAVSGERGTAARGRLSAEGEMAALLRVAERLVDPAAGVDVERVMLAPAGASGDASDDTMRIVLDGTSVGSGS